MLGRLRQGLVLPLLVLVVAGCGNGVVEAPALVEPATPRPEVSLGVTAVQVEPADPHRLAVVIDNRGRRRVEAQVQVRLAGDDPGDVLVELTKDAGVVAAGESRVVRFDIPAQIPTRPCYTLAVQVVPGGEVKEMADQGTRTYRVCPGR